MCKFPLYGIRCNRKLFQLLLQVLYAAVDGIQRKDMKTMLKSTCMNYDELPIFLNARMIANVLGISPTRTYELMNEKGFPKLRVGNRIVVPREKFLAWLEENITED